MLPPLTPAVARALTTASDHAHAERNSEILPFHLLTALLIEEEGQAANLALAHGFDRLAWIVSPPPAAVETPLPPSSALSSLLDDARVLALELAGDRTVSGDVALHALAGVPALAQWLASFGVNVSALRAAVEATRPPPPVVGDVLRIGDHTDRFDTARILDASANRAREALRVLEDHARFVLDDAMLSGMAKSMRHALTRAMHEFAPEGLLEARDTEADVGTAITDEREQERFTLADVVAAAAGRLGEALRSLEEHGKLVHPLLGERMQALRYQGYTLERSLSLSGKARARLKDARLYVLLSRASCVASLEWTIGEAAAGGASIIQLREKSMPDRDLLALAIEARRWARKAGVLFIVNDRPDIARLADADGVHLGQDDLSVREARRILGPDALIGVSTHEQTQVERAVRDGASYIGIGPTFPSGTKSFAAFPGLEFIRQATATTSLPAFAIGGIHAGNILEVVRAGARRVAVGLAVAGAAEPRFAARNLLSSLEG